MTGHLLASFCSAGRNICSDPKGDRDYNSCVNINDGGVICVIFLLLPALLLMLLPAQTIQAEISNAKGISFRGNASILAKPDIAYFFLKVDASGVDYQSSNDNAKTRLDDLRDVVTTVLGKTPEFTVYKVSSSPKAPSYDEEYDQKEYLVGLAKAIKGEEIAPKEDAKESKPKEIETSTYIFFSLDTFTKEIVLTLRSKLAEKKLAFDDSDPLAMFDFGYVRPGQSVILFGLADPSIHLKALAKQAHDKARANAEVIALASNTKIGKLIGIAGCGGGMEGSVEAPDQELIGRELGPLTNDPERLSISFSKTFEFQIK